MTLKLNKVFVDVEVHVWAKFHQAKCSSSSVIVLMKKKNLKSATVLKTIPSALGLLRTVVNRNHTVKWHFHFRLTIKQVDTEQ